MCTGAAGPVVLVACEAMACRKFVIEQRGGAEIVVGCLEMPSDACKHAGTRPRMAWIGGIRERQRCERVDDENDVRVVRTRHVVAAIEIGSDVALDDEELVQLPLREPSRAVPCAAVSVSATARQ